ncbi:hypothetical protein HK101_006714, partial [Irineochytrium annulatum]
MTPTSTLDSDSDSDDHEPPRSPCSRELRPFGYGNGHGQPPTSGSRVTGRGGALPARSMASFSFTSAFAEGLTLDPKRSRSVRGSFAVAGAGFGAERARGGRGGIVGGNVGKRCAERKGKESMVNWSTPLPLPRAVFDMAPEFQEGGVLPRKAPAMRSGAEPIVEKPCPAAAELPREVWGHVLAWLDVRSLVVLGRASKDFRQVAYEDDLLWKSICERDQLDMDEIEASTPTSYRSSCIHHHITRRRLLYSRVPNPTHRRHLNSHSLGVTSVLARPPPSSRPLTPAEIITGSWDHTVNVWRVVRVDPAPEGMDVEDCDDAEDGGRWGWWGAGGMEDDDDGSTFGEMAARAMDVESVAGSAESDVEDAAGAWVDERRIVSGTGTLGLEL